MTLLNPYRFAATGGGGPPWLESFDKADGALGPDLTWTVTRGSVTVASNQAKTTLASTLSTARAEHDIGSADQYAQCLVYKNGASTSLNMVRLLLRYSTSADTYYGAIIKANNTYDVYKRVSGTATFGLDDGSVSWSDGDEFRFEVSGTSLTGYINDVPFFSLTDASISSGDRAGIEFFQNSVSVDDFEAGAL